MSGAAIIDEKYVNVIKEAIGWINDFLKESKWLAGDDLTIADLAILATITSNFVSIIVLVSKFCWIYFS